MSTTLPYQVEFTADDTTVEEGECTTLRWDVENVQAVYLDGEGVVGHSNKTVCPKQTQTYTLHVVTVSGTQDYEATVSVPAVVGVQFAADNNTIKSGECTTLRWDVENVQAVYLDGGGVVEHG
ncbi:MAG TPA: hypothetical protein PKE45_16730, partial [Caldilineaceae bacterium]|nr:hypothetical protein [Caldilineaceae bacterium]